ncbi:MAG TPA: transporter substrate-binding domain-containing protein [Burkholderiaceae bacterium]|jgi:ABC-type amino acid transport substrate-binding protein|nr:transporter substrate-binding domain-containing protein [Burkholderiaceae bacterium]
MNRLRRVVLGGACALALAPLLVALARAGELDDLRRRGRLRIAVYRDFPPFSQDGRGIDVRIGQALAQALQLSPDVMPFDADEKVEDDLRNMVWRGTLLGYGPADVMLHVPVDHPFAERNPQVRIFAPYFREKLQLVRNLARVPALDSLAALQGQPLGAEDGTLASIVLLSADGGRLRGNVQHYHSTGQALDELKAGRLTAVMGLRSELQAGMAGAEGFELTDPVAPGIPTGGWTLGLAVKADDEPLAAALQAAMDGLLAQGHIERIFREHGVSWGRP